MQEIQLEVEVREGRGGKGALSALRGKSRVPAVIYGGRKPPLPVSVGEKELTRAAREGGANAILRLKHPQGEDTVILKEIARHAVTQKPLHVDFQRVGLKDVVEVEVPVKVVGEAPGVKLHGGILEHILRQVTVRCAAGLIPQQIEADISSLDIGKAIHVKELKLPPDVELRMDPEQIVVNVVSPEAEEVAPAEAEAAAPAEPEVIAKGKKEEEPEEAAPAKAEKAAKPEKAEKPKEEKK